MRNMPIMLSLAALACATPLIASDSRDAEIRARAADAIANLDERGQKDLRIGVPLGSCALSQFVPYRKVKKGG